MPQRGSLNISINQELIVIKKKESLALREKSILILLAY